MSEHSALAEGRKLAVVVGVDVYRISSGLGKLRYASRDAAALSGALRDNGYTVYEMTHAVAREPGKETRAPLADYIRDQIGVVLDTPNLGPDDSVVISFHGHGVKFDRTATDKTPAFFFCPADAVVTGVESADKLADRNHLLPLEELYEQLGTCGAATKLLIVDACRNDPTKPSGFRSGLASATLPTLPPPPGGTAAFFSCKPNQRALEDPELKQGVFTHFLVEGLRGEADLPLSRGRPADGKVTLSELSTYVANNTYAYVLHSYQVTQTPELRGTYDLNLPLSQVAKHHAAGDVRDDNSLKMKLVWCPPTGKGGFLMGSPESQKGADENEMPQHQVVLTRGFWMGKYEVTRDEWKSVMGTQPWAAHGEWFEMLGKPQTPATYISCNDAMVFYDRLTKREWRSGRLPKGERYSLPTEAQWEYACRAGTNTRWSFGSDESQLEDHAWWERNAMGGIVEEEPSVHQVGLKKPNAWKLHDMHGNVWEWCSDWIRDYSRDPQQDPQGPDRGEYCVLRGGSWSNTAKHTRSADRFGVPPYFMDENVGFRVVRTAP